MNEPYGYSHSHGIPIPMGFTTPMLPYTPLDWMLILPNISHLVFHLMSGSVTLWAYMAQRINPLNRPSCSVILSESVLESIDASTVYTVLVQIIHKTTSYHSAGASSRPFYWQWQMEAGCFLEKVWGRKNSKPVFALELFEFIHEYEYSNYIQNAGSQLIKKLSSICAHEQLNSRV